MLVGSGQIHWKVISIVATKNVLTDEILDILPLLRMQVEDMTVLVTEQMEIVHTMEGTMISIRIES